MVTEGLELFSVNVPETLEGKTISECSIREQTGCSVVAIKTDQGTRTIPSPGKVLTPGAEMLLIGTMDAEKCYLDEYAKDTST